MRQSMRLLTVRPDDLTARKSAAASLKSRAGSAGSNGIDATKAMI
jgi:hypothetical protein